MVVAWQRPNAKLSGPFVETRPNLWLWNSIRAIETPKAIAIGRAAALGVETLRRRIGVGDGERPQHREAHPDRGAVELPEDLLHQVDEAVRAPGEEGEVLVRRPLPRQRLVGARQVPAHVRDREVVRR